MPNIVNIINFVRGAEPRDRSIDLVAPVREQIRLMQQHKLPGTFLLQYDAMVREDLMALLRPLDPEQFELGIWLEMNEPHTTAAGLPWRGAPGFEWDWHANVGFSVGYTPRERELLVDAAVTKFQEVTGREPQSVGAWMLDAHTLAYLHDRHNIIASCNCKDQWGTDGYTIWGGYWNQGYYPSRRNALCPAQSPPNQIGLPVFRMLGSDPVSQYDLGLSVKKGATPVQKVESLEPVYTNAGADPVWVDWFFDETFDNESLAFAYAQVGQENSFGWPKMEKGLTYQFELLARKLGDWCIERMADTGRWYKEQFPLTPPTAVCALRPYKQRDKQSLWYNCKDYRVNVFADDAGLRLRDIFVFDDAYTERYIGTPCLTEYLVYDNLPVMDGNRMSGEGILAGAYVLNPDGTPAVLAGDPVSSDGNALTVQVQGGSIRADERGITLSGGLSLRMRWLASRSALKGVENGRMLFEHNGWRYAVQVAGDVQTHKGGVTIMPVNGRIVLTPERLPQ